MPACCSGIIPGSAKLNRAPAPVTELSPQPTYSILLSLLHWLSSTPMWFGYLLLLKFFYHMWVFWFPGASQLQGEMFTSLSPFIPQHLSKRNENTYSKYTDMNFVKPSLAVFGGSCNPFLEIFQEVQIPPRLCPEQELQMWFSWLVNTWSLSIPLFITMFITGFIVFRFSCLTYISISFTQ